MLLICFFNLDVLLYICVLSVMIVMYFTCQISVKELLSSRPLGPVYTDANNDHLCTFYRCLDDISKS